MSYTCEHCNNTYSSRQSRWNHIKKHHTNENIHIIDKNIQIPIQKTIHECIYCKKIFNTYFIKWRHEKKCKEQKPNTKLEIIEKQNLKLEKQNEDMKLQLEELKKLIQKSLKIHPKTLQKINKQLVNGTVVNGDVNFVIQLGYEDFNKVLSENEK